MSSERKSTRILTGFALAAALYCFAIPGSAADKKPSASEEDSALRLIKTRCAFCHSNSGVLRDLASCLDDYGPGGLDDFLSTHNVPEVESRETILEYLEKSTIRPANSPKEGR